MAKEFIGQEYMTATNGKGLREDSRTSRFLGRVTVTATVSATVVSIIMVIFCIFFTMCPVIGTSMMTTLNATGADTDNAITCILGKPQHGDIVVYKLYLKNTSDYELYLTLQYRAKNGDTQAQIDLNALNEKYCQVDQNGNYMYIIKRLIGVAGDKISMCRTGDEYAIYLNGEKMEESYLDPLVAQPNAINFQQLWNVLNNRNLAYMNDWCTLRWENCVDVNKFTETQDGSEPSRFMLIIPNGYSFLMGDNRGSANTVYNHSWDSTYFGPLPEANFDSICVDVIDKNVNMPEYLWQKFVYFFCFGWLWQK